MFEKGFQSLREDKLQRYMQYARQLAAAAAQQRGFRGAVRRACSPGLALWRRVACHLPQSPALLWLLCAQVMALASDAVLGCMQLLWGGCSGRGTES